MTLFKRFEVWVLLILIGGGLWYVFQIEEVDEEGGRAPIIAADPHASENKPPPPPFSLQQTTLTRDGDHYLAEITVHCRNDGKKPLDLVPPGTHLRAAGGREVPIFFLPFQATESVPAEGESTATLRYWLSSEDVNGPVSLQIGSESIPVKIGGFEADKLPDKQSRSFTGTDWSLEA